MGEAEELLEPCSCGGTCGYRHDTTSATLTVWHRADGATTIRSRQIADSYLAQRGRSRAVALAGMVAEWHVLEGTMAITNARDPANWPDIIGQTVVVTGTLQDYDRRGIARAIANAGGYHSERVARDTALLVTGARPGAIKVRDAKAFGVPVIGDRDFMTLLQRSVRTLLQRSVRAREQRPKLPFTPSTAPKPAPSPYSDPPSIVTGTTATPFVPESAPLLGELRFITTRRRVMVGDVVDVGAGCQGTAEMVVQQSDRAGNVTYRVEVRVGGVLATVTTPPPVAPAKRSPTFDELLERERYLRGERG